MRSFDYIRIIVKKPIFLMFKKIIPAICLVVLCACSGDDTTATDPCKVTSVARKVLLVDDVTLSTNYNPTFSNKLTFEYDAQNRISKIHGGLVLMAPGQGLNSGWLYYNEVEDAVSYHNDTIRGDYSNNQTNKPYIKEFVTNHNNQLTYRKLTSFIYNTTVIDEYTYTYTANQVIENKNGQLYRTFYLENGNVTKVECIYHDSSTGAITGKKDYVFSNYDDKPNLVKGKYFVNGLLYTAFSSNNFQRMDTNTYTYSNNEYVLNGNGYLFFTLTYDSDNTADIFEKVCQ